MHTLYMQIHTQSKLFICSDLNVQFLHPFCPHRHTHTHTRECIHHIKKNLFDCNRYVYAMHSMAFYCYCYICEQVIVVSDYAIYYASYFQFKYTVNDTFFCGVWIWWGTFEHILQQLLLIIISGINAILIDFIWLYTV